VPVFQEIDELIRAVGSLEAAIHEVQVQVDRLESRSSALGLEPGAGGAAAATIFQREEELSNTPTNLSTVHDDVAEVETHLPEDSITI